MKVGLALSVIALVLVVFLPSLAVAQGRCGTVPCKGGCYDSNANGVCETVPAGFYSPADDNALYECLPGTFSDEGARQCTECPPGSAAPTVQSSSCSSCRPGEYAPAVGSMLCLKCKTKYYLGFGSYAIFYDGTDWFCLAPAATTQPKTTSPSWSVAPTPLNSIPLTQRPSVVSSMAPSAASPLYNLSIVPTTASPSALLSQSPTFSPTTAVTSKSGDKKYKRDVFWKFFFPWIAAFGTVGLLGGCCSCWFCRGKKRTKNKPKKSLSVNSAASFSLSRKGGGAPHPSSPTTTLGSITIGVGGDGAGWGDDDAGSESKGSAVLRDLCGHDKVVSGTPNDYPSKSSASIKATNGRRSVNGGNDNESLTDLYYDEMSLADSTADDYSMKF